LYFLVSYNDEIHRDGTFFLIPLALIIYIDFIIRYFQPLDEKTKMGRRKGFT
jgi:hypothetical protein